MVYVPIRLFSGRTVIRVSKYLCMHIYLWKACKMHVCIIKYIMYFIEIHASIMKYTCILYKCIKRFVFKALLTQCGVSQSVVRKVHGWKRWALSCTLQWNLPSLRKPTSAVGTYLAIRPSPPGLSGAILAHRQLMADVNHIYRGLQSSSSVSAWFRNSAATWELTPRKFHCSTFPPPCAAAGTRPEPFGHIAHLRSSLYFFGYFQWG